MNSIIRARRSVLAACAALAAVTVPLAALAQGTFPDRPVTFIVPFAPGGGTDIGGRILANKLSVKWGQPVVVDNKAGAGGLVGADAAAKAKPDGYTLFVGNVGTQAINPSLYKKIPYNPETAFAPISLFAELPFVLVVNPKVPAKDVKELVALAKAAPDKYTFASSGNGGSPHLTAEIFQAAAGIKLVHVPYKGGGPAMADLMAGHVDMLFASALETSGPVKTGKLRALAVTSAERSPALPEVPTISEAGIANAESGSWLALLAPGATPQAIVDKISADVKAVMALPEVRDAMIAQGATPRGTTPAELKKVIESDTERYGKVIKARDLKVE